MISIIVPCFNAEATVAETIESALSQAVDCELIAVDDGSRDGTADVLRGFGDRIIALFGPNRGVSAARNSGIEIARGQWILFLDSDDLLSPGTVGMRLQAAGSDHDLVICDWREFSVENGEVIEGRLRSVDEAAILQEPELAMATDAWAPPAAVLYRRTLVDKVGGFRADLPVIQDARFLFDAAYHGADIVRSAHVGARYRVLADSLSRKSPSRFWADVLLNAQQMEAMWRRRDAFGPERQVAMRGIYNQAARGLFASADPRFFEAESELKRLGEPPLHVAIAGPLARAVGLKAAQRLLSLVGRG